MKSAIKTKETISGFILAGGKSSRMKSDKALLLIQGEPLLGRMTRLLKPFCQTVAISGNNPDHEDFNLEMVRDLYPGCGPISGIFSSLKHSSTQWNLLVSVDVPFINEDFLQTMVSGIGNFDCIIPEHEGKVEPLMGLYNKQIIPILEEMIGQGDYKLMNLLSKLNVRYLNCNNMAKKFPRLFLNMNSPEDYQSI